MMEMRWTDTYDGYVRAEWALFARDPSRSAATRAVVADISIARVLDVGCGAGQELRPFLGSAKTLGVGVDLSSEVGRAGRELFERQQPLSRVGFVRAAAECLPFVASSFDLVICRLALPYTHNGRALAEMGRVLRPGGLLLLTFHHFRYYLKELEDAIAKRRAKTALHAFRVVIAGAVYHVTGRQPRTRLTGDETFQTIWLLKRELRHHGLELRRILDDSPPAAPTVLIVRPGDTVSSIHKPSAPSHR